MRREHAIFIVIGCCLGCSKRTSSSAPITVDVPTTSATVTVDAQPHTATVATTADASVDAPLRGTFSPRPALAVTERSVHAPLLSLEFPMLAPSVAASTRAAIDPQLEALGWGKCTAYRKPEPDRVGLCSRTCDAHVITESVVSVSCTTFDGVESKAALAEGMGGGGNPHLQLHTLVRDKGTFRDLALAELFRAGVDGDAIVRRECAKIVAASDVGDAAVPCSTFAFALDRDGLIVTWQADDLSRETPIVVPWSRLASSLDPTGAAHAFVWSSP